MNITSTWRNAVAFEKGRTKCCSVELPQKTEQKSCFSQPLPHQRTVPTPRYQSRCYNVRHKYSTNLHARILQSGTRMRRSTRISAMSASPSFSTLSASVAPQVSFGKKVISLPQSVSCVERTQPRHESKISGIMEVNAKELNLRNTLSVRFSVIRSIRFFVNALIKIQSGQVFGWISLDENGSSWRGVIGRFIVTLFRTSSDHVRLSHHFSFRDNIKSSSIISSLSIHLPCWYTVENSASNSREAEDAIAHFLNLNFNLCEAVDIHFQVVSSLDVFGMVLYAK